MFRLYHSNDLEVLKSLLVNQLSQEELADPFAAEHILVQSQGMAHWLKIQIAEELGVAANLEFPLPSSFVWKILNTLKTDLPEKSDFEKEAMAWKLFRLLPTLKDDPQFSAITQYLIADTSADEQIKCFQLASNLADTYDQYLVYRPDWLLEWERGNDDVHGVNEQHYEGQKWQAELWRLLVADTESLSQSLFHRARLLEQLPKLVADNHQALAEHMPKRIFVFGIAALPVSYWQVLQAISPYVDVHFYLLNPCKNFWGDIISPKAQLKLLSRSSQAADYLSIGNPLLASWGRLGRDFVTLVHSAINGEEHGEDNSNQYGEQAAINTPIYDVEAYVDPESATLLQHIQQDILELSDASQAGFTQQSLLNSEDKKIIAEDDSSLRIINCHSPLREVQVLHDQILHWMEQDPELKPRDIVVMLPDVDTYAPYIEAVFGSAESELRLPWALADQSLGQENPVIESFLQLLNLPNSRVTASEVLGLLEVEAIRVAFGIQEEDLGLIQNWIDQSHIRWGISADNKQSFDLPTNDFNTWRKGLRQLQLGLMMPDDANFALDINSEWAINAVDGNQQALVLGQLIALIDRIEYWQTELKEDSSAEQWQQKILALLADMFVADVYQASHLQSIRDAAVEWTSALAHGAVDQTINLLVVQQHFKQVLNKQVGWQRFLVGPINFCTLMPMRSIPFKVICMLGMNDDTYPRSVPSLGFDLMAKASYRRGDRSRREDDRYLFLEALIAAQDKLYVSYRGHEPKENSELQPSVLVSELIDYVASGYCLEHSRSMPHKDSEKLCRQWLVKEQRLQPFYPGYFEDTANKNLGFDNSLDQSHHKTWAEVARVSNESSRDDHSQMSEDFLNQVIAFDEPWPAQRNLELQELLAVLIHPSRAFVQRRLNIQLNLAGRSNDYVEVEDTEPFLTDGLQQYLIKQTLYQEKIDQEKVNGTNLDSVDSNNASHKDHSPSSERMLATGELPQGIFSELAVDQAEHEVDNLYQTLTPLIAEHHTNQIFSTGLSHQQYEQGIVLTSAMPDLFRSGLVLSRVGRVRGRDFLSSWLQHLLLCAQEKIDFITYDKTTYCIGIDGKLDEGYRAYQFMSMTKEQAQHHLQPLLAYAMESMSNPVAFFVDSTYSYILNALMYLVRENKQVEEPMSQYDFFQSLWQQVVDGDLEIDWDNLNSVIEGGFGQENTELGDAYHQRCFGQALQSGDVEFWQQALATGLKLLLPAFLQLTYDQDKNLQLIIESSYSSTFSSQTEEA